MNGNKNGAGISRNQEDIYVLRDGGKGGGKAWHTYITSRQLRTQQSS
jgi:hypothetical protein